jgi:ATP phosphoribosyltransferase
MKANLMRTIKTISESSAVLIASRKRKDDGEAVLSDMIAGLGKTLRK